MQSGTTQIVPDTEHRGLMAQLPQPLRDYAQLARFDRPIGWWRAVLALCPGDRPTAHREAETAKAHRG